MSMPRIGEKKDISSACYVDPKAKKDKPVDRAVAKSGTMSQAYKYKTVQRKI